MRKGFIYITFFFSCIRGEIVLNEQLSIEGFTNLDTSWDTRQVNANREGLNLNWPLPRRLDKFGTDINDQGQFNMIPLHTEMQLTAIGPEWCSIKHSGVIRADFLGTTDENQSMFRLLYSYSHLLWKHYGLLIGKYRHPLYTDGCTPNVVTYDGGEPPDMQIRVPQVRFSLRSSLEDEPTHEFMSVFASQSAGSLSSGPQGRTSDYIRRAIMPNLHAQYRYWQDGNLFGVGVDGLRLIPRLVSEDNVRENTSVTSVITTAYTTLNLNSWLLKMKLIYSENASSQDLPNSYAVKTKDPDTAVQAYTPIRALSYWADVDIWPEAEFMPGIFVGAYKSIGTSERVFLDPETNQPIVFGGEPDINHIVRVIPRLWWTCEPLVVGAEIDVTHAGFGAELDDFVQPQNVTSVTNVRFLVSVYYNF